MTGETAGSIASDTAPFGVRAWGDYDNDGFLDLFVTTLGVGGAPQVNYLYHNNGNGSFTRILTGSPVGDIGRSVSCAWGDYDNDGFLDLVVARGGVFDAENNSLYHNNGNSNNWLKVRCVGTVSNRSAIGAKVRVKATIAGKTVWQLREINPWDALEAHFGLGNATNVDVLRIEWPSGTVQEFPNVAAKQILTKLEPPRLGARLVNGSPEFAVQSWAGFQYQLEASTNLVTWSPVGMLITTNATGATLIPSATPADSNWKFYRAVSH